MAGLRASMRSKQTSSLDARPVAQNAWHWKPASNSSCIPRQVAMAGSLPWSIKLDGEMKAIRPAEVQREVSGVPILSWVRIRATRTPRRPTTSRTNAPPMYRLALQTKAANTVTTNRLRNENCLRCWRNWNNAMAPRMRARIAWNEAAGMLLLSLVSIISSTITIKAPQPYPYHGNGDGSVRRSAVRMPWNPHSALSRTMRSLVQ